ncbi:major capsid protein, partial [Glutamicibacter sp. V16R2B1]|uniref:major capsid protein n=1 Tax=Glutamicibacter sp. V16R2B1 TaxID=2036207 RepID=UPI0010FE3068
MNIQVQALLNGETDLTTLTDEQLGDIRRAVAEEFASIDPGDGVVPDAELLGQMDRIADAASRVKGEFDSRAATADRASRVGTLRELFTAQPDPEPEPELVAEPATSEPAALSEEPAPVAAAATRPTLTQLAQHGLTAQPAAQTRPRIVADAVLTAAANVPGLDMGAPVSWGDLGQATAEQLRRLRTSGSSEVYNTASIRWDYPEDRQLGDGDSTAQIDHALSIRQVMASMEEQGGIEAVVAAGGVCGPPEVFYDLQVDSVASRPLRDSLPSFQPKRGAINFNPSPTFAAVGSSATAFWTAANDANPTSPTTKPVQTFNCPSPVQEYVYGIPTRVQFSNFQERYSPEWVAANTQLALANAARLAEVQLWTKMASSTYSTRIGASALVSFTRDLMALLELQVSSYRYRHRLPETFLMRAVFPSFVKGLFRTDFLRQTATQDPNWLKIADAYITSLFAARGVIPTYVMDGLPKSTAGTTLGTNAWDFPDQFFAAATDGSALGAPVADASAGSASAGTYWPSRLAFSLF